MQSTNDSGTFGYLLVLLAVYFVPAIIASIGRRRQQNAIFVLNLLLGWTVIGWIAALIWAFIKDPPKPPQS